MTAPNETKQEKKKTKRKENDSGFNTHIHMRFYEIWSRHQLSRTISNLRGVFNGLKCAQA